MVIIKMLLVLLLKIIIYPISLLPMPVLYVLAKPIRFLLQYVIRYRKKVVGSNIQTSFPDYTAQEHQAVVNGFYTYLSELIVEIIKSFTMSEKNAASRMKIRNPEFTNAIYDNGKNIVLAFGHFNNWEWPGLGSRSQIKHNPASIYKSVKNKPLNDWILVNRERFGNILMSMQETRDYYDSKPKEITINAFISDQNPRDPKNAIWVDFLGRKTAFLKGTAKFGQTYDMPVVFADIQRVKQGYYEVTFSEIALNPEQVSEEEIITRFANKLEAQIQANPDRWLWSHKRWKHQFPDTN